MINMSCKHFIKLLMTLSQEKIKQFSGTGLVLYQHLNDIQHYHCNLINDAKMSSLTHGADALLKYLSQISTYHHPYHDGFHFINTKGTLTHIAQFFSPPLIKPIRNIQGQGARTLCALHGSTIEGVIAIGTISSNHDVFLFKKGKMNQPASTKQLSTALTI